MKLNLKNIIGHKVFNNNKEIGTVTDILFDDKKWVCRYFEISPINSSPEERILLPIPLVISINWTQDKIEYLLREIKLIKAPRIKEKEIISRKFELDLANHFKTRKYWETRYIDSMPNPTRWAPERVIFIDQEYHNRIPRKSIKADDDHSSVRRLSQITQFDAYANNGEIGKLNDLIIDYKDWKIISAVIRIYTLQDIKKDVLVATQLISEISYPDKGVILDLKRDEIIRSPEFSESTPINKRMVIKHFDFNGKPKS
ncbi:MAG: PRC-barrel domain-containing protein [Crocinitomicaceae bacterium]|nr:PRC-barrel domain-containing protein [Crocinitomicaceae bacterium]